MAKSGPIAVHPLEWFFKVSTGGPSIKLPIQSLRLGSAESAPMVLENVDEFPPVFLKANFIFCLERSVTLLKEIYNQNANLWKNIAWHYYIQSWAYYFSLWASPACV